MASKPDQTLQMTSGDSENRHKYASSKMVSHVPTQCLQRHFQVNGENDKPSKSPVVVTRHLAS